jgi:hypothetical protein
MLGMVGSISRALNEESIVRKSEKYQGLDFVEPCVL